MMRNAGTLQASTGSVESDRVMPVPKMKLDRHGSRFRTIVRATVVAFGLGAAGLCCLGRASNLRRDPSSATGFYIPTDICDAVREMRSTVPARELEAFARHPDGPALEHFGLGVGIRANWVRALPANEGGMTRLAQYFVDHGVCHPDNMSALVLLALWQQLRGQPISLQEHLESWKKYDAKDCSFGDLAGSSEARCGCPMPFDVSACGGPANGR